jgi:hypothetical protein
VGSLCTVSDPLATRVAVPLAPAGTTRARSMQTLTPTVRVEEKGYLMGTAQLAVVATRELGAVVRKRARRLPGDP